MKKTQKRAIIDTHELMRTQKYQAVKKIQQMTSRVTKNDQAGLKWSPQFENVPMSSSEGIVYWAQCSLRSLSFYWRGQFNPLTRRRQDVEFQKMSSDEWRNDKCWGFHQIAQWLFRISAHIQPNDPEWKINIPEDRILETNLKTSARQVGKDASLLLNEIKTCDYSFGQFGIATIIAAI